MRERGEDLGQLGALGGNEAIEEVLLGHLAVDVELAAAGDLQQLGLAQGVEKSASRDEHASGGGVGREEDATRKRARLYPCCFRYNQANWRFPDWRGDGNGRRGDGNGRALERQRVTLGRSATAPERPSVAPERPSVAPERPRAAPERPGAAPRWTRAAPERSGFARREAFFTAPGPRGVPRRPSFRGCAMRALANLKYFPLPSLTPRTGLAGSTE